MSAITEFGTNEVLIYICKQQLEELQKKLRQQLRGGLFTPAEANAYTKLVDSIYALAAGAAVGCRRSQAETNKLVHIKDELDTLITWNIGHPVGLYNCR